MYVCMNVCMHVCAYVLCLYALCMCYARARARVCTYVHHVTWIFSLLPTIHNSIHISLFKKHKKTNRKAPHPPKSDQNAAAAQHKKCTKYQKWKHYSLEVTACLL